MNMADAAREAQKIADVLAMADKHFTAEGEMNAALHMAPTVRPAPLAAAVRAAAEDAAALAKRLHDDAVIEAGPG